MGLAASQCRLLFITSRQTDVSYKMQRLSNSLLTLARDDEDIATEYNRRLNATKMVPTSDFMDLSYSAMMGDNAMVTGNPKFINERLSNGQVGRVVLADGEYSKLGLSTSSGKPGDIKSQTGCATSTAYAAKMAGVSESEAAGYINKASGVSNTTATSDVKTIADAAKTKFGEYPTTAITMSIDDIVDYMGRVGDLGVKNNGDWVGDYEGENGALDANKINLSYKELLEGNYTMIVGKTAGNKKWTDTANEAWGNIKNIAESYKKAFSEALGIDISNSHINSLIDEYLDKNVNPNKGEYSAGSGKYHGGSLTNGPSDSTCAARASSRAQAGLLGAYSNNEKSSGGDDSTMMSVNLSELARQILNVILTNISDDKNGFSAVTSALNPRYSNSQSHYTAYDKSTTESFVLNSKGYSVSEYEKQVKHFCQTEKQISDQSTIGAVIEYLKQAAGADKATSTTATATPETTVQYYAKMFDELNAYGWTAGGAGENIIANVKNDNYLYNHGVFSNSVEYTSVPDEETQKGAEAWYNTETKKIKRKEKEIEMQQTQLQSEYTALNTEIESVKSIISKNIERSFQYCNA